MTKLVEPFDYDVINNSYVTWLVTTNQNWVFALDTDIYTDIYTDERLSEAPHYVGVWDLKTVKSLDSVSLTCDVVNLIAENKFHQYVAVGMENSATFQSINKWSKDNVKCWQIHCFEQFNSMFITWCKTSFIWNKTTS